MKNSSQFNPKHQKFTQTILAYYKTHGRRFPWRETDNPYHILVSEFMLQQTQTERVEKKYPEFIQMFPAPENLAKASTQEVLSAWQGMGYNRRAIALKQTAGSIITNHGGNVPDTYDDLIAFPGVGKASASAVLAFAYKKPVVFIETNIRRVYIHFFFQNKETVHDTEIYPLVTKTLDTQNPREWYYALMDYGVMLKKTIPNPNVKSAHYHKQSPFEGSDRQIRGRIIRLLLSRQTATAKTISTTLQTPMEKLNPILARLMKEEFLTKSGSRYRIK